MSTSRGDKRRAQTGALRAPGKRYGVTPARVSQIVNSAIIGKR